MHISASTPTPAALSEEELDRAFAREQDRRVRGDDELIYSFDRVPIARVEFEDVEHVKVTRTALHIR